MGTTDQSVTSSENVMNRVECVLDIDPGKHQVFLMHCPVTLPLNFASHPWFVCNERGNISRWEVLDRKNEHDDSWGYIQRDYFPIESGIEVIPFIRKEPLWKGELLATIEGDRAKEIIDLLRESATRYPYRDTYSLVGINSNTYAQWVLDHFDDVDASLPINSIGKHATKRSIRLLSRRLRERASKRREQIRIWSANKKMASKIRALADKIEKL